MYILINEKPYFFESGIAYPCSISADKVVVPFEGGVKVEKFDGVYTESEIKSRLGLKMIDSWDAENDKIVRVSNKVIDNIDSKIESTIDPVEEKVEKVESQDIVLDDVENAEDESAETPEKKIFGKRK